MRITEEHERAFRSLQHNEDFRKVLSWIGVEAELSNERLIFSQNEDVNVLKGRCQALSEMLMAIDKLYKEHK